MNKVSAEPKLKALKSAYKDLDGTPYYRPTPWVVVAYDDDKKEVLYSYVGDRHFDEAWRDLMKENPDLRSRIKRMYVDYSAAKTGAVKIADRSAALQVKSEVGEGGGIFVVLDGKITVKEFPWRSNNLRSYNEAKQQAYEFAGKKTGGREPLATRIRRIAGKLLVAEVGNERKYYRYGLQEGRNAIYIGDKTDDELKLSFEDDKTRGTVQQILDHWKRTSGTVYRDPSVQPEELKAFEEGFLEGFRTEAEKILRKKQLIQ